jgi:hypothetical protein
MKTNSGIFILFFLVSIFSKEITAQQSTFVQVLYDPSGGVQAYSISKTLDHNFIIAGEKDNGGLIVKMSPSGAILWNRKYVSDEDEKFNDISQTCDSGFIITGSHGNFYLTGPERKILCLKINSIGDTIWSKKIEIGTDAVGLSVQQTADSGYILTGLTNQSATPNSFIVVCKLNKSGMVSWTKTFSAGDHNNYAYSVKQIPDGGYVVSGFMENTSPYEASALLFKLTPEGIVAWSFKPGFSSQTYSSGGDIEVTNNGLTFALNTPELGTMLVKTDFSGNVIWSKSYTYAYQYQQPDVPRPTLVKTNDGGHLLLTGEFPPVILSKIDSSGNAIWAKELVVISSDIIDSYDHGIIVLGNGPIIGVIMADIMNPQIGIIKMDSVGYSTGCVFDSWPNGMDYQVVLTPVAISSANAGSIAIASQTVTDAPLTIANQCISIFGKVPELNMKENLFTIVPQPNDGRFQINIKQEYYSKIQSVEVFSATGQKVYQSYDPVNPGNSFDFSSTPPGLYFMKVEIAYKIYAQKFIIVK